MRPPRERTQRAFRAYTDLLDTAEWIKAEMHEPLELFGLTMSGFRLLEVLDREGALPEADAGRRVNPSSHTDSEGPRFHPGAQRHPPKNEATTAKTNSELREKAAD